MLQASYGRAWTRNILLEEEEEESRKELQTDPLESPDEFNVLLRSPFLGQLTGTLTCRHRAEISGPEGSSHKVSADQHLMQVEFRGALKGNLSRSYTA